MSTTVTTPPHAGQPDRQRREITPTDDAVPMLDTAKFEHMQRIANVMASTSMIPDALRKVKVGQDMVELPPSQVVANCFLVVNQSVRWGMDPFAVAQCVSIVHGKLCYEGKLVSAVLDAKLGLKLFHHLTGAPGDARRIYLSDRPFDQAVLDQLVPGVRFLDRRMFDGSVAEWKTTGTNSPWSPKNFDRMLVYRGTRDWCRIYEPAIMLGVYTPDEMLDLSENVRAERARDVGRPSLHDRITGRQPIEVSRAEGFGYEQAQAIEGSSPAAIEGPKDEAPVDDDDACPEPRAETREQLEGIDPDASAAEHEAALELEAGERETSRTESSANHDPVLRSLLTECAAKMLEIAAGTQPPKDRGEALAAAKDAWKGELPSNLGDLKKIVDRAYSVITGKLNVPAAVKLIATEVGVDEADIRPAAR
ncbi:hypothetical protein D3218_12885 [Aureimonas flava]|uniref:Recombinase RecT n=1 Tax=Aureimonas flava TaxID=2320271 RepID=A0A3A1WQX8_9HYPH|nr:hypothetical protein [Aureimonas flava]RIY00178.1 hypothetical protein D3218_12885 [Aureimonas flava]